MIFLATASSLHPGCLLTTKIVYWIPATEPGKSKTTPAVIWSLVTPVLMGVVAVEPV